MMKINIKIRNGHGVNSFKGQDLDVESAKHLMDVAREIIVGDRLIEATPLMYLESDIEEDDEFEAGVLGAAPSVVTPLKAFPVKTPVAPKQNVSSTLKPIQPDPVVYSTPKGEDDSAMASQLKKIAVPPTVVLSIQDRLAEMNKDYFTTGIKYREHHGEIVTTYRTRYKCPKCSSQGNHYIPENARNVFCRDCNQPLIPKQAMPKFLESDSFGNFFIAEEPNTKFIRA